MVEMVPSEFLSKERKKYNSHYSSGEKFMNFFSENYYQNGDNTDSKSNKIDIWNMLDDIHNRLKENITISYFYPKQILELSHGNNERCRIYETKYNRMRNKIHHKSCFEYPHKELDKSHNKGKEYGKRYK